MIIKDYISSTDIKLEKLSKDRRAQFLNLILYWLITYYLRKVIECP